MPSLLESIKDVHVELFSLYYCSVAMPYYLPIGSCILLPLDDYNKIDWLFYLIKRFQSYVLYFVPFVPK